MSAEGKKLKTSGRMNEYELDLMRWFWEKHILTIRVKAHDRVEAISKAVAREAQGRYDKAAWKVRSKLEKLDAGVVGHRLISGEEPKYCKLVLGDRT
jgi:hypothetical protein